MTLTSPIMCTGYISQSSTNNLFMRLLSLAIISTTVFLSCKGQSNSTIKTREVGYPQVGWKIDIPSDFTILDSAQINDNNSRGATAVENTFNDKLDLSEMQTLVSLKKGETNTLTATITPFDPDVDGDWEEEDLKVKSNIVETLESQAPGTSVDTSSHVKKIGGLEFRKFRVIATLPNKMVINMAIYSRLHMGYDFGITVTYSDEGIGKGLA